VRERNIEAHLFEGVKRLGGWCLKVIPNPAGMPDRIVVLPGGRTYFVELKRPGEKPSELQLHRHEELSKIGHPVAVLDTKERVDEWLQKRSR
jgi:hypothetical protein